MSISYSHYGHIVLLNGNRTCGATITDRIDVHQEESNSFLLMINASSIACRDCGIWLQGFQNYHKAERACNDCGVIDGTSVPCASCRFYVCIKHSYDTEDGTELSLCAECLENYNKYRLDTAEYAVKILNEALKADFNAIHAIFLGEYIINDKLADHPTIQVGKSSTELDCYAVRIIGLINGLFGIRSDGYGRVCMVMREDNPSFIDKFTLTPEEETKEIDSIVSQITPENLHPEFPQGENAIDTINQLVQAFESADEEKQAEFGDMIRKAWIIGTEHNAKRSYDAHARINEQIFGTDEYSPIRRASRRPI